MALTSIQNHVGVALGDPLTSANFNTKLRDLFQANIDAYKTLPDLIPLLWDITEAPTETTVTGLSGTNIPPGIVYVDMSTAPQGQVVVLSFSSVTGPRLVLPINNDSAPEANIHIDCTGYTVNNSAAADLPIANRFRIHSSGATLIGATSNRLFCKDGFYFHLILNELEANIATLNQLTTAQAEYVQLQTDLDNNILNQINTTNDNQAESLLSTLDGRRQAAMYWAIDRLNSNAGRNNLFQHAEFDTLSNLTSTNPTVDIPINHDMMKYVLVVPDTANASSINFRFVNGFGHPDDTFTNILISVSVNARKAIPFTVDLQPLTGQNADFSSDHEELVIYANPSAGIAQMLFL